MLLYASAGIQSVFSPRSVQKTSPFEDLAMMFFSHTICSCFPHPTENVTRMSTTRWLPNVSGLAQAAGT